MVDLWLFVAKKSAKTGLLVVLDVLLRHLDVRCHWSSAMVMFICLLVLALLWLIFKFLLFNFVLLVFLVLGLIKHFLQFFLLLHCLFFWGLFQQRINVWVLQIKLFNLNVFIQFLAFGFLDFLDLVSRTLFCRKVVSCGVETCDCGLTKIRLGVLEGSGGLPEVGVVYAGAFHGRSSGKSGFSDFIAVDGEFWVYDELLFVVVEESLFWREKVGVGGSGHFLVRCHLTFSHVIFAHVMEIDFFGLIVMRGFKQRLRFLRQFPPDFRFLISNPLANIDHGFFGIFLISSQLIDKVDSRV